MRNRSDLSEVKMALATVLKEMKEKNIKTDTVTTFLKYLLNRDIEGFPNVPEFDVFLKDFPVLAVTTNKDFKAYYKTALNDYHCDATTGIIYYKKTSCPLFFNNKKQTLSQEYERAKSLFLHGKHLEINYANYTQYLHSFSISNLNFSDGEAEMAKAREIMKGLALWEHPNAKLWLQEDKKSAVIPQSMCAIC